MKTVLFNSVIIIFHQNHDGVMKFDVHCQFCFRICFCVVVRLENWLWLGHDNDRMRK